MIQSAFKSAYTQQVSAQNQGISNIWSGAKNAAVLAAGTLGLTGALGSGVAAKGASHALAGRVGGIGGNIMLATLQQKKESAQAKEQQKQMFSSEQVGETIKAQLGDNPINRPALKQLNTVFDTLAGAKFQGIINKEGNLDMKQVGNVFAGSSEEELKNAFDKVVEKAKTPEEFEMLNSVWDKITNARNKKKEQDIIVDVVSNLKGGNK